LLEVAEARRRAGGKVDPGRTPTLPLVLGSSDFLARLLVQHPDWVEELDAPLSGVGEPARPAPEWGAIREAKYRGLLRIAAGELAGRPFRDTLRALSDLADRCLIAGMECTARELGSAPPTLFALGKLGGRELNFSSDVDLLFLYEPPGGDDNLERNQIASQFIRHFKKQMELPTKDGFLFRVDLDLRPEGDTGALANSVSAALGYYETFGAEWERQMLIRLRALTGPQQVVDAFCEEIRPFVYRRSIDPAVLGAVREMKDRIEEQRRDARHDLEADLKEGPGGIRDVEFLVQSLQLFWGGRTPEICTGNTLDALAELSQRGLLPDETASTLSTSYIWLRRAEHAQQLIEEQQTAKFPRDAKAQLGLARRMGYGEASGDAARKHLLDDWNSFRNQVRSHFEALVLRPRGAGSEASPMKRSLEHSLRDAIRGGALESRLQTAAAHFLERRSGDAAARRLDGPVLCGLARVLASQPLAAEFLSRRPRLLERIADADASTLDSWPGERDGSDNECTDDLETALDALRIFRHEETCLIACLDLGGVVPFETVSSVLSGLAETITRRSLRLAQHQLGAGDAVADFAVVGMGRIAGREFTYHSDLDLIFLNSGAPDHISTTARIGQRMISYLGTMTGAGVAYAVDTRLRPSGNQGVLVASFEGFERYQLESADTWEHMAVLRSRTIAGHVQTAQRTLDRVRQKLLNRTSEPWAYIAELRARVERERSRISGDAMALKTGRGGLMDVDFLAKGALLELPSERFPPLPSVPAMLRSVAHGRRIERLLDDYAFLRVVESRVRWIAGRAVDEVNTEEDQVELLAELMNPGTEAAALLAELAAVLDRIRASFEAVIERGSISAICD
jgi:glutamate-ammonia-ligase adenylyltransferase